MTPCRAPAGAPWPNGGCDGGDADGCIRLADCLHAGAGVAQDRARAIRLAEAACPSAPGGCWMAGVFLLRVYQEKETRVDTTDPGWARGTEALDKGCAAGLGNACVALAEAQARVGRSPEAVAGTLERAAGALRREGEQRSGPSCGEAARLLAQGLGPPRAPDEEASLTARACELDPHPCACTAERRPSFRPGLDGGWWR